jgi:hypothetical protein
MSLDSTSKKVNFLYSLKKYIVDNLFTIEGVYVMFDKFLPPETSVDRWISVITGKLQRDCVSDFNFEIYCTTRKDYEGNKLVELLDLVVGYFSSDLTETDGLKRIPFYDAETQQQNGSMLVIDCIEGDAMDAPDLSKFVILSIRLKMASKI